MFVDFCQRVSFCIHPENFCITPTASVCQKKVFGATQKVFVLQNKHHFRGMLHPRRSILHTQKVAPTKVARKDTEQKHGKHGSGALLSSFPLLLVVVLAEHGGCLSSVDRDRGLRIWNEREARRNECETRRQLSLERVRNSLVVKSRRLSLLLVVTRSHNLEQIP